LLAISGVRKSYPGVEALAGVDLHVSAGEVHAVLGENGAGKSTLMKVISGAVKPDGGEMVLDGVDFSPTTPDDARRAGIGIVYQELSLVPPLSIGENILLGRWPTGRFGTIDWRQLYDGARKSLAKVGLDVDPEARVGRLGMAERQLVEIAKALAASEVKVLLLDEPTSALSERESARLFEIIATLKDEGVAVVYVSHRLKEINQIADRVTVLRDGRIIGTVATSDVDEARLASMMVGHEVRDVLEYGSSESERSHPVLVAIGLARPPRLKPVDLEVHSGEVLGVFGLMGAGRTRLARTLFGLEPATQGRIEVDGRRVEVDSPATAIAAGLGYLAEDRSGGLVPRLSVAANVTLATLEDSSKGPILDFDREREITERYAGELAMKISSVDQLAETLSGGNQQKVLLARWLCSDARVLILDDPTRGIDVGAKQEVFRIVRKLAGDGVAVIYLTSEIKEARLLGHRLLVMADGRVAKEVDPRTSEEEIMAIAGGAHG
jgi:ABC-type sugar transport system ATPase subunit